MGVQMDSQKNKKKLTRKWFPGHDLYLTLLIVVTVGVVTIVKACNN